MTSNEIAVVEEDGQLVGFCVIDPRQRYLSQLFVHPSSQGKGAGSVLLDWAKSVCPEGFTLHNLMRNTGSRRFYERHGEVHFILVLLRPSTTLGRAE